MSLLVRLLGRLRGTGVEGTPLWPTHHKSGLIQACRCNTADDRHGKGYRVILRHVFRCFSGSSAESKSFHERRWSWCNSFGVEHVEMGSPTWDSRHAPRRREVWCTISAGHVESPEHCSGNFVFVGGHGPRFVTRSLISCHMLTYTVQPMLKDGTWDNMVMAAQVKTDFANVNYVKALCQTPIRTDKEYGGSTCLQIEHAGQGYHNYQRVSYYVTICIIEI